MSDTLKSYRIKYDVHCVFENFFGKEIIIKNCYSEVHAKYKLGIYCEQKYGSEFEFIKFISVTNTSPLNIDSSTNDVFNMFKDIFKM